MPINLHSLTAIAFDLDETLYDRGVAMKELLGTWLPHHPKHLMDEVLRRDERGHSPRIPFFDWLAGTCPVLGKTGEQMWKQFQFDLPALIFADPAAAPLLEYLSNVPFKLALLTNGNQEYQLAKLHAIQLDEFFPSDRVLVSGALGYDKPDQRAFAALIQALDASPEQILYVGDHAEKDIVGAKRCGLQTCWLRRWDHGGICPEADVTIDFLSELRTILQPPALA